MSSAQLDANVWPTTVHESIYERPIPSCVDQRLKWLRTSFTLSLRENLQHRLPIEICENIAQHLLQDSAVQAFRRLWLGGLGGDSYRLSVNVSDLTTLWAGYVEFEGRRYVNSLSTSPSPSTSARLFALHREVSVNIFIATDVLGVRDIIVAPLGELPMIVRESGVGWNIYRRKVIPFLIMGDFDVSSLPFTDIVTLTDRSI
jgi:hypothetical protein